MRCGHCHGEDHTRRTCALTGHAPRDARWAIGEILRLRKDYHARCATTDEWQGYYDEVDRIMADLDARTAYRTRAALPPPVRADLDRTVRLLVEVEDLAAAREAGWLRPTARA